MDCLRLEVLLRYIHEETTTDATEEITRHMEQCQTCRQEAQTLRTISLHLAQVPWSRSAAGECVDMMTLAAYIDQQLIGAERQRVAQHIARCEDCRDLWGVAEQQLARVATASRTVPPALLQQAMQLGAPRRPPVVPWWHMVVESVSQGAAALFPAPSWRWAFGGAVVAGLLVLYVGRDAFRVPNAPVVHTAPAQRTYGYGFGTAVEVLVEGNVPLSSALRQALLTYQQTSTLLARQELLGLLNTPTLRLPTERVTTIELKRSVQQALAESGPSTLHTIHIQLIKNGLLLIGKTL